MTVSAHNKSSAEAIKPPGQAGWRCVESANLIVASIVCFLGLCRPIAADESDPADPTLATNSFGDLKSMAESILRANFPNRYKREKDWGRTKEVFDGVHVRRE